MGYQEMKEDFSTEHATWIIAYCIDTDSFFCTNQRYFFWEHDKKFESEQDAIQYFKNNLDEFITARNEIAENCGGIRKDGMIFLENTKERWTDRKLPDTMIKESV